MSKVNDKSDVADAADAADETEDIATKILHLLSIYPVISPTMLQGGLGPQMRPAQWRPVLAQLLEDGKVVETPLSKRTPNDRYNTYSRLSLPGTVLSDD